MKKASLSLMLLGRYFITQSQVIDLPIVYSQMDTVQAVHHLFEAKRTGSKIYRSVGLPILLTGSGVAFIGSAFSAMAQAGKSNILSVILISGGPGLILTSIGLARNVRYSQRQEREIISLYQAGEPLPRWVKRRLKTKFFRSY